MAAPIILWNPQSVKVSDDAGNSIIKTTLAPPVTSTSRYKAYDPLRPRTLSRVPRLASFCIRALSQYPEQLHQLGSTRLYFDSKKGGTDCVLRAVLPNWKTPDFSLLDVDPRLWATIIQIYSNPPAILSSYPCQLSDPHVPLLNQVPSTPDFALLTVLDLQGSRNITDDNILSLKVLHNLTALDLSRCQSITARGIEVLSRTLAFNELGERRGPWALRILRMRFCYNVDKKIFCFLLRFPLLSIVDVRDTLCRVEDIKQPFFSATDDYIFALSIEGALKYLSKENSCMFSNATPYTLSLQDKLLASESGKQISSRSRTSMIPALSRHNSFVVLPPSHGSTFSGRSVAGPIQFGNVDTNEYLEIQDEKERRRQMWQERMTGSVYDEGSVHGCSCDECCYEFDSGAASEEEQDYDDISLVSSNDSDDGRDDSDAQLLSALQESMMGRTEETSNIPTAETLSGNRVFPTVDEAETRRIDGVQITAQVDPFYQQRPYLPPRPRHSRINKASCGLALLRMPPPWSTLDSITPESQHVKRKVPEGEGRLGKASLIVNRKRKTSMQILQTELSKRRRPATAIKEPEATLVNVRRLSPPPSPTSTVCDASDMPIQRRPALRPISDLRPPPRSSLIRIPRLKLDPILNSVEGPSSRPPTGNAVFASRPTKKSRNMSLAEGFRLQAQKPSVFPGVAIKTPTSTSKSKSKRLAATRGASSKFRNINRSPAETGGFDWNRWRMR